MLGGRHGSPSPSPRLHLLQQPRRRRPQLLYWMLRPAMRPSGGLLSLRKLKRRRRRSVGERYADCPQVGNLNINSPRAAAPMRLASARTWTEARAERYAQRGTCRGDELTALIERARYSRIPRSKHRLSTTHKPTTLRTSHNYNPCRCSMSLSDLKIAERMHCQEYKYGIQKRIIRGESQYRSVSKTRTVSG